MNKPVCFLPWVHLYVDTRGNVKSCCNANVVYGNIREQTIREIWFGEKVQKFRELNLNGVKDRRCGHCWKREAVGKVSLRQESQDRFHIQQELNFEPQVPISFDLRFSNLCNLKCRTCWHGASSSWFSDAKVLGNNSGSKAVISATENVDLVGAIFKLDVDPEEFYFGGGEPLMMQEHYQILETLISKKLTNVRLRYNTNLTRLKLGQWNVLELWSQFSDVHVDISIDALFKQGEYIRDGLRWNDFIENFKVLVDNNMRVRIAPTISVLNALELPSLHRYFVSNNFIGINDIQLNVLDRPNFYNIKSLPNELKKRFKSNIEQHVEWVKSVGGEDALIKEFESTAEYALAHDWSDQQENFKRYNQILDNVRDQHGPSLMPHLSGLWKE